MKAKCELCGTKEHLIEFPTGSGDHTFCMECAGKASLEALRWLEMGGHAFIMTDLEREKQ